MTKIKLSILGLLAFFLSATFFISCSKDSEGINSKEELITAKELEFVGKDHNSILDKTYAFLKNNPQNQNKAKLEEFLINDTKSNTRYSQKSNDIGIECIKKEFNRTSFASKSLYSKTTTNELSVIEESYLDKLNIILSNVGFNDNSVFLNISKLEKEIEADENLDNKQLITLFSATQTARYSYTYWSENFNKWAALANNSSNKQAKTMKGKDVVKADVAGAVGAAAATWVANAVPGAGQVAYGSAIVAGAAASSVGQAVLELLDWW
jgi:hypothetical protein